MEKIERAVIRQLGYRTAKGECLETLQDVARHGADAGFGGFTYYRDTVAFYKKNRAEIVELVEGLAQELGEEPLAMVAGFNCLKDHGVTVGEVGKVLYGQVRGDVAELIANALSWFALEEVARRLSDDC
jgi:hypothetical protein